MLILVLGSGATKINLKNAASLGSSQVAGENQRYI
jgi:hypothetical protein